MQVRNVPASGAAYWTALCAASVFGADCGDSVSHLLGLGHIRGVPFLAVGFGLALLAERRARAASVASYWLAIVILRAGATNFGDLLTHDLKLGYWTVAAILAVCVVGCVAAAAGTRRGERGVPPVDALYWLTMGLAGTFGTVGGDAMSRALGGAGMSTLVLLPLMVAVFGTRSVAGAGAAVWSYWLVVSAVRSIGTTFGDWSADGIGLGEATLVSGVLLVWIVAAAGRRRIVAVGRPA